MKEPTPAQLIATASRLLQAAQRSLRKKTITRPVSPRKPIPQDDPEYLSPEEASKMFADLRAQLASMP